MHKAGRHGVWSYKPKRDVGYRNLDNFKDKII